MLIIIKFLFRPLWVEGSNWFESHGCCQNNIPGLYENQSNAWTRNCWSYWGKSFYFVMILRTLLVEANVRCCMFFFLTPGTVKVGFLLIKLNDDKMVAKSFYHGIAPLLADPSRNKKIQLWLVRLFLSLIQIFTQLGIQFNFGLWDCF